MKERLTTLMMDPLERLILTRENREHLNLEQTTVGQILVIIVVTGASPNHLVLAPGGLPNKIMDRAQQDI